MSQLKTVRREMGLKSSLVIVSAPSRRRDGDYLLTGTKLAIPTYGEGFRAGNIKKGVDFVLRSNEMDRRPLSSNTYTHPTNGLEADYKTTERGERKYVDVNLRLAVAVAGPTREASEAIGRIAKGIDVVVSFLDDMRLGKI